MINKVLYIITATFLMISSVFAHDLSLNHVHGKWTLKKINDNTCSVFQLPVSEKGDYTIRGVVFFHVFKDDGVEYVRIDAGYPYDTGKNIKVSIDGNNYQFFGENEFAWSSKDDRLIVDAMKAGKEMIVVGFSKKGTETTDTYTLIGFTNAYNSMQKDC